MQQIDRTVTYTVRLSESEHTAFRILSERLNHSKEYIGGEQWVEQVIEMIGTESTDAIMKLFQEVK